MSMKKSKIQSQFDNLLSLEDVCIIPFETKHKEHKYLCELIISRVFFLNKYFVVVKDAKFGPLFHLDLDFRGYKVYNTDIHSLKLIKFYPDELERFSPAIKVGCTDIKQWFRYIKASTGVYLDMNLFS